MRKIAFDPATGYVTAIVLHLVEAWDCKPEHEAPLCGETHVHPGYRTAGSIDEAFGIAKRDNVLLCGACVLKKMARA